MIAHVETIHQFFVLVTFCGYFSCNESQSHQFETEAACKEFVDGYRRNKVQSSATCFDRKTGRIIDDSRGRK